MQGAVRGAGGARAHGLAGKRHGAAREAGAGVTGAAGTLRGSGGAGRRAVPSGPAAPDGGRSYALTGRDHDGAVPVTRHSARYRGIGGV